MKKIIAQMRKVSIPSVREIREKHEIAEMALSLVKEQADRFSEIVGVEFGGSFAKETWLPGSADVDIFIKFREDVTEKKFTEISQKIGFSAMKKFRPYVRYSEHPYVEAKIRNTKVNIVPCYDVREGFWKSAADRSPFHTDYMKRSLTKPMKDEVRILKTFLKAGGIYGAEIAKQGFSGYVAEVLILNYQTFDKVVREFASVNKDHIVGRTEKKFETPVVIIDPIDSNRNLAAAISEESLGKFVLMCRAFVAKPAKFLFGKWRRAVSVRDLENVLVVRFGITPRSPDIIWGQIKRAAASLKKQLDLGGFHVLRTKTYTDEKKNAVLLFLLESVEIPKTVAKRGPEHFSRDDSNRFIAKNVSKSRLMWVGQDHRIIALDKREHSDARLFLQNLLGKHLGKSGVPKGLRKDLRRRVEVFVASKRSSKSIKEVARDLVLTDETIFYSN